MNINIKHFDGPEMGPNCPLILSAAARLAKCRQISIFAMPMAFTRKYREIMENTGKYDLQPSTLIICLNISFLLFYQAIS